MNCAKFGIAKKLILALLALTMVVSLTLANGDNRKDITGGGTVNQACDHDWEEIDRTSATCSTPGTISYECKICPATKEDPLTASHNPDADGVCTVCGVGRRVFFVKDGGTGDGSTPETPVGSHPVTLL